MAIRSHNIYSFIHPGIIIAAVLWCAAVMQARAEGPSSPAYNFLNIPTSTHIMGLGGVNISTVEDDLAVVGQNPALLGPEIDMQAMVNYMRYVGESNFGGVTFGTGIDDRSAWSAGVQYFDYGKIDGYDEGGNPTGAFAPKDLAINAMYSRDIYGNWRGGANLKFLGSFYEAYSAMAIAVDLGVNYYDAERDQSLSLVVANLGGQVKRFNDAYDRLPIDVRLGWTGSFGHFPVRFSVTAWGLTRWRLPYYETGDGTTANMGGIRDSFGSNLFRHLIFGADLIASRNFNVCIGYNYRTRTDMATHSRTLLSGLSIGAGLKVKSFAVGIAFAQPHSGAPTFMFNLSTNLYELRHH